MRIPKAAWWVIAPLSWMWQYLIYVPSYKLTNFVISAFWGYAVWLPGFRGLRWGDRPRFKIETRPWFLDRL